MALAIWKRVGNFSFWKTALDLLRFTSSIRRWILFFSYFLFSHLRCVFLHIFVLQTLFCYLIHMKWDLDYTSFIYTNQILVSAQLNQLLTIRSIQLYYAKYSCECNFIKSILIMIHIYIIFKRIDVLFIDV